MTNEEIAAAIAETESRSRSNTHRLDKLEQRQDNLDKLVTAVAGMQKDLEHTQGDVQEIKGDVKAMMETPRKRWDTVISVIITAIVSALVGAVLALIIK
ncbi:MAG: hypothetical protein ACI3V3_03865 [Faecousia sp.]